MVRTAGTSIGRGVNRIVFWFLATVTVVVLLFGYHTSTSGPSASVPLSAQVSPVRTTATPDASSGASSRATSGATTGATSAATPGSSGSGSSGSGSTDGADTSASATTVTGSSEDTRWGPVQVELSISGGKITDVSVPVYPNGNGRDAEINSYALPQLVQETIAAQSADIDMVSGATVTSDGYLRSLQSALDKAGL